MRDALHYVIVRDVVEVLGFLFENRSKLGGGLVWEDLARNRGKMADQKACHASSTVGLLRLVEKLFHMHDHRSTQVRVADTETILGVARVVLVQIVIMDLVEIIGATRTVVEGVNKPRFAFMECEGGSVTLGLHEPSQAYKFLCCGNSMLDPQGTYHDRGQKTHA